MVFFHKKLTLKTAIIDVFAILFIYFVGLLLLPRVFFFEILNGILFGTASAVCIIYSISLPDLFRSGELGVALIRIGIVISWFVTATVAITRLYFFEFSPQTSGRTFDTLLGSPALLLTMAASLHIIAIGMIENNLYQKSVNITAAALFCGAIIVFLFKLVGSF